ncbi:MAG: hypothetical protein AMJ73_07500 [candidate division Zixibacteria bacterium SM1_73]|nr:MAG: hypothetical protein AMJ73_07500 [candidate division Zixibacteria bacterium SM1_73]
MIKKLLILVILFLASIPAFAQSVDTAWVRRYDNSDDQALAIAADNSGNVYVTGDTYYKETSYDYATIKYYPNGDTAWIRTYDGPANDFDFVWSVAADACGNVYVTGQSFGTGTGFDYATVKYYPNGDTAWVRRYNGPGNSEDVAYDIAVDGSNNVYVTGHSHGGGTKRDYATIKYDPNGDTVWVRRYNEPANEDDFARAIAVDGSGNVYVTGWSWSSVTQSDYLTLRYYPNGDTAWVRRYNGPESDHDLAYAVALDSSGNVYVTGVIEYSYGYGTTDDYGTIKYFPNGDTAWVRRYDGSANSRDEPSAITVDGFDNVYVTGNSLGSGTYCDYTTIKYAPNGDTIWVRIYNGPGNSDDVACDITVDDSNNVYVTGYSFESGTGYDYATIKYYPDGDTAWVRRYNDPVNEDDYALAIVVNDSNNVYVTGASIGNGANYDFATTKYVEFLCGDVNTDGLIDLDDVVYLMNYLFRDGPPPVPILQAGDVNLDGVINSADVVFLINYLFKGGPPPCSQEK